MRGLCVLVATLLLACSLSAQEYLRPTVDTDSSTSSICTGTNYASLAMSGVYTGKSGAGPITSGASPILQSGSTVSPYLRFQARTFSSWGSRSSAYTALTLNVNNLCTITTGSDVGGSCGVEYSLNNGSTWTTLFSTGATTLQATTTATIASAADLTQLQVRVCAMGQGAPHPFIPGTGALTLYDIWTTGTPATSPASYTVLAP